MASLKLSQVPVGSTFIDSNSKYSDTALEWRVVAHDVDGQGVTTLILKRRRSDLVFPYDAKEPLNHDTYKRDYGNTSYEKSNILQFLNSDKLANEWYSAQHEYDQAPVDPYVSVGGAYSNKDAFLSHFTDDFKARLIPVEKMGVTRKVHLPSCDELAQSSKIHIEHNTDIVFDTGANYNINAFDDESGGSLMFYLYVRGTHDEIAPNASIAYYNGKFDYLGENEYSRNDHYPSNAFASLMPVVYMDSDSPVEYNTTDQKYYAKWDVAPILTVQEVATWQASAFNMIVKVQDEDADTVTTIVKIDNTEIYHNDVTPLNTNITVSSSSVFDSLSYGEHTITVTADDGEKQATNEQTFRKAENAPYVLSTVSENRVFVDRDTTYNGQPIEWYIAAKEVDGKGVVSLMMKTPIANHEYDAKEVYNPVTALASKGNYNYSLSNILQWMNSKGGANEWYENQHQYDSPPSYESEAGFLYNFGESLLNAMESIEKFGVSRKVHLPSIPELIHDATYATDGAIDSRYIDKEIKYPLFNKGFNDYQNLVTKQYPSSIPALIVRGGTDKIGTDSGLSAEILYNTENSNYSSWTRKWRAVGRDAYYNSNIYAIPTIYLSGDLVPVIYDSEADKYYLDYSIETQYKDYGKHKAGFNIGVKINCSTAIGDTVIKAYIDDNTEASGIYTINRMKEYVDIAISDEAVEDLENGAHTITLKSDTYGILGSTQVEYTKVDESVPIVLTNAIGNVVSGFTTSFQTYDEDGDNINVVIKIDTTTIDTITNVQQNVDIPIVISDGRLGALNYGNHNLVIEASDGTNTSTSTIPFVKNSVPTVSLDSYDLGEVVEPFSIEVTSNSADGDNITIKAYIDEQEIQV